MIPDLIALSLAVLVGMFARELFGWRSAPNTERVVTGRDVDRLICQNAEPEQWRLN